MTILAKYRIALVAAAIEYAKNPTVLSPGAWVYEQVAKLSPYTATFLEKVGLEAFDEVPSSFPRKCKTTDDRRDWIINSLCEYLSYVLVLVETDALLSRIPELVPYLVLGPNVPTGTFTQRFLNKLRYKNFSKVDPVRLGDLIMSIEEANATLEAALDLPPEQRDMMALSIFFNTRIFDLDTLHDNTVVRVDSVVVGQLVSVKKMARRSDGWRNRPILNWWSSLPAIYRKVIAIVALILAGNISVVLLAHEILLLVR